MIRSRSVRGRWGDDRTREAQASNRTADARLQPPYLEEVVQLADGRTLGVAEFGDPDGPTFLWFHGTPGGRGQVPPIARDVARQRGLRIVSVERPGIGDSTPHVYDGLTGFARDIEELADRKRLDRFGLLGLSGGGAYVLACAHTLPRRVVAAAVFGGVAPVLGDEAASGGPVSLAVPFRGALRLFHEPIGVTASAAMAMLRPLKDQAFSVALRVLLAREDREVLMEPRMREVFISDMLQASQSGMRSLVYDLLLFAHPWDFSLRDVRVPVHFFHGDADSLVPFHHAEHMAALVPAAALTRLPGAGHLASLASVEQAVDFVLSRWSPRRVRRRV